MLTRVSNWLIIPFAVFFSFGAMTLMAGDCSVATLKGSYAFVEQGTAVVSSVTVPYASSGTATFDGAGNFSGTVTANAGGTIINHTFTGTYSVNADCTFSTEFTGALSDVHHQVGSITGQGIFQEGHYIYTDTNLIVSGTARRPSSGK